MSEIYAMLFSISRKLIQIAKALVPPLWREKKYIFKTQSTGDDIDIIDYSYQNRRNQYTAKKLYRSECFHRIIANYSNSLEKSS